MSSNYFAEEYYSLTDAYDPSTVVYKRTQDGWPRHDYWRGNPLSSRNYINPNLAGYLQIKRKIFNEPSADEEQPKLVWFNDYYYSGGMIWPHNEAYKKEREIILYR